MPIDAIVGNMMASPMRLGTDVRVDGYTWDLRIINRRVRMTLRQGHTPIPRAVERYIDRRWRNAAEMIRGSISVYYYTTLEGKHSLGLAWREIFLPPAIWDLARVHNALDDPQQWRMIAQGYNACYGCTRLGLCADGCRFGK